MFSTLFRQFLKLEGHNFWSYLQRLFIGVAALLVFTSLQTAPNTGSKGLSFLIILSYVVLTISTLACAAVQCGILHELRKENTLGLVMLTGVKGSSLVGAAFFSKYLQIVILILLQIPFCLFAETLGGVAYANVLAVYLFLTCWLFLVSSFAAFFGVIFSSRHEAQIVAIPLLLIILVGSALVFERSIFDILNEYAIFRIRLVPLLTCCFSFCFLGLFFNYLGMQSFYRYLNNPLSFLDKMKFKKRNALRFIKFSPIVSRIIRRSGAVKKWRRPIEDKDMMLYPREPLAPFSSFFKHDEDMLRISTIMSSICFLFIMVMVFRFLEAVFLYTLLWLGLILYKSWVRLYNNFAYEVEENTFSSLFLIPRPARYIIQAKYNSSLIYNREFLATYTVLNALALWFGAFYLGFGHAFILIITTVGILWMKKLIDLLIVLLIFLDRKTSRVSAGSAVILIITAYILFPIPVLLVSIAGFIWVNNSLKQSVKKYCEAA